MIPARWLALFLAWTLLLHSLTPALASGQNRVSAPKYPGNRLWNVWNAGVTRAPLVAYGYTYDKVGNRLSRVETKNPGQPNQSVLTTTYSYTRAGGDVPTNASDVPDASRYASLAAYAASYWANDWLWKETRPDGTSVYYDYNANGAMVRERTYNASNSFVKQSNLTFSFDGKVLSQTFSEPGSLMYITSQVLYNYDGDGNRIGLQRQQLGTVGMSYGVVKSENHEYLVDTSQPYAEVIQEKAWATDGAGTSLDGIALIYRYDIGLDRLHYFKYQMPINGPPSLTPVLSHWVLFDGLGSTRMLVGDSGSVVDEFGYNDAFGIPYRVVPSGGRAVAGPGFFLNGQQWDGGSSWGGAGTIWSGSPAFNAGEGLYFNRARYYQPGLGRFIGEDPFSGHNYEPTTLHRYLYVANDSVNKIDPSGRETLGGLMISSSMATSLANIKNNVDFAIYQQVYAVFGQDASPEFLASLLLKSAGVNLSAETIRKIGFGILITYVTVKVAKWLAVRSVILGSRIMSSLGDSILLQRMLPEATENAFTQWLTNGGKKILNVGGEGEMANVINLNVRDMSRYPWEVIEEKVAKSGGILIEGDARAMPFADEVMDEVVATKFPSVGGDGLHELSLAESFRVLKSGGKVRFHSQSSGGQYFMPLLEGAGFKNVSFDGKYAVGFKP